MKLLLHPVMFDALFDRLLDESSDAGARAHSLRVLINMGRHEYAGHLRRLRASKSPYFELAWALESGRRRGGTLDIVLPERGWHWVERLVKDTPPLTVRYTP